MSTGPVEALGGVKEGVNKGEKGRRRRVIPGAKGKREKREEEEEEEEEEEDERKDKEAREDGREGKEEEQVKELRGERGKGRLEQRQIGQGTMHGRSISIEIKGQERVNKPSSSLPVESPNVRLGGKKLGNSLRKDVHRCPTNDFINGRSEFYGDKHLLNQGQREREMDQSPPQETFENSERKKPSPIAPLDSCASSDSRRLVHTSLNPFLYNEEKVLVPNPNEPSHSTQSGYPRHHIQSALNDSNHVNSGFKEIRSAMKVETTSSMDSVACTTFHQDVSHRSQTISNFSQANQDASQTANISYNAINDPAQTANPPFQRKNIAFATVAAINKADAAAAAAEKANAAARAAKYAADAVAAALAMATAAKEKKTQSVVLSSVLSSSPYTSSSLPYTAPVLKAEAPEVAVGLSAGVGRGRRGEKAAVAVYSLISDSSESEGEDG